MQWDMKNPYKTLNLDRCDDVDSLNYMSFPMFFFSADNVGYHI